jgi:hypothetical protein
MDEIFWFGQIFFIMFIVCGIYLSLAYAGLADEESARTVEPDSAPVPVAHPCAGNTELIVSH